MPVRALTFALASTLAIAVATAAALGQTGAIVGTVALQTGNRAEQPPRYYRGPYRASHADEPAPLPVESVVVYVERLPAPEGGWPASPAPVAMHQHHDRFVPHVLPILAGTTVTFPNDDDYYHNVFSVVAGDRFDLGRYGQGDTREQTFPAPAVVVVRCEIHPGMKAYILVRDNPCFAVPGPDGRFRLPQVPVGTWSLAAWHPTQGETRRTVVVRAGQDAVADFAF